MGVLALWIVATICAVAVERGGPSFLNYIRICAIVVGGCLTVFIIARHYKGQRCSACGHKMIGIGVRYNFCPKCGATMREERK